MSSLIDKLTFSAPERRLAPEKAEALSRRLGLIDLLVDKQDQVTRVKYPDALPEMPEQVSAATTADQPQVSQANSEEVNKLAEIRAQQAVEAAFYDQAA